MVKAIISYIKACFSRGSISAQLSQSNRRLVLLEDRRRQSVAKLDSLREKLTRLSTKIDTELSEAQRLHEKYESSLEETREKNRVHEETINELVAAHKLILARYDAETAIEVRRRTAAAGE